MGRKIEPAIAVAVGLGISACTGVGAVRDAAVSMPAPRHETSAVDASRPRTDASDAGAHIALPACAAWSEPNGRCRCGEPSTWPRGVVPRPSVGGAIPTRVVVHPRCPSAPRVTRWLGREPHVPLAATDGHDLFATDATCCAAWSTLGARWLAIDAYGQVVGHAETAGGSGYDVTRCFELCMHTLDGASGAGLYASEGGPWRSPPSAQWTPEASQRAAFESAVQTLESTFALEARSSSSCDPGSPAQRTLFFRLPTASDAPLRPTQFAAIGGRYFAVLYLATDGRWLATHFELADAYAPSNAFMPFAVFDMDGDGVPEIVRHQNSGDGWEDAVVRTRRGDSQCGIGWRVDAISVGGSTA